MKEKIINKSKNTTSENENINAKFLEIEKSLVLKMQQATTSTKLEKTERLLEIAETRISTQMNFIMLTLTISGLIAGLFVYKQYVSAKEISDLRDNIKKEIDEKILVHLNNEKQSRITRKLIDYLENQKFIRDHNGILLSQIAESEEFEKSNLELIASQIDKEYNNISHTVFYTNYEAFSWIIYISSRLKSNPVIDLKFKKYSRMKEIDVHHVGPQSIYLSMMEYFSKETSIYESDIVDLINLEISLLSEKDQIHCTYPLVNKYQSKKIGQAIVSLFKANPQRLNNFAFDKISIDLFFEQDWEIIIDKEGKILGSNSNLKNKELIGYKVSLRKDENSYLSKKLNLEKNE